MTERTLVRALRRTLTRWGREHPIFQSAPSGPPEARIVGLDPIRVLVIGSDLAVGYGAATHDDALTGGLARGVHRATGRGVVVQNRAQRSQSLDDTMKTLGLVGAATFNLVVWSPQLLDGFQSPERGQLHHALTEALPFLLQTASPGARIVLSGYGVPTARDPLTEISRLVARRFNRSLARVAERFDGVQAIEPPPFASLSTPGAFDRDYYQRWADDVVAARSAVRARTA